ncbi:GIY-YIG nuclease family protein [Corynebacterium hesseae]|uniref:GIY-YIG nuclease family protein n=1 Tax=Corynebacterium TaxID=1716 RepID=UPI000AAD2CA1|nr:MULTISPECIES: GIY-YIG nuclease family protein [unclassified Corynebacterium]
MASPLDFKRLELDSNTPIGPIFPANERCGIYVIEFDDGTKYVGQSIDVVKRFRDHTHGSNHHESWGDVVALSFAPAPPLELDILEKQMIQYQLDAGVLLRNRSGVLASEGPSPLDLVITVTDQNIGSLGIGNHHSLIAQLLSVALKHRGQQSWKRTHPQKFLKP